MTDDDRLRSFEAAAEAAYAKMYDAATATEAAARDSDAKEALCDAIGLARSLGRADVRRHGLSAADPHQGGVSLAVCEHWLTPQPILDRLRPRDGRATQ